MSRIVDVLEAERIKHRNHRFGRDYYTKQASVPSGKVKVDETEILPIEENEEIHLYRAVPVSTDDSNNELSEALNPVRITVELNTDDQDISEITNDSSSSLVNYYDVKNSKVYYQSSDNDQKKIEIKINEKEASVYGSDDSTQQLPIKSDINDNEYTITNANIYKQDVVKFDNLKITSDEYKNLQSDNPQISSITVTNVSNADNKPIPISRKKYEIKQTFNNSVMVGKENQNKNNGLVSPTMFTKKSDNTLIKKIYSNPVVRSFALTNREQIPYEFQHDKSKSTNLASELNKTKSTEQVHKINIIKDSPSNNLIDKIDKVDNIEELSQVNNTFSLEFSDNGSLREQSVYNDFDFIELKEKRLVASRLGEFSKSFPNLNKKELTNQSHNKILFTKFKHEASEENKNLDQSMPASNCISDQSYNQLVVTKLKDDPDENKNLDEPMPLSNYISVKALKKLFETNDVSHHQKNKPVHSLTARSISKEMKQKLKSYSRDQYDDNIPNTNDIIGG